MSVADMDAEKIKNCIRDVLSERAVVDPETHRDHHQSLSDLLPELRDFLEYRRLRMKQIQRRQELWNLARNSAIGAAVVSTVGGVIFLLGWIGDWGIRAFLHWVQSAPTGGG